MYILSVNTSRSTRLAELGREVAGALKILCPLPIAGLAAGQGAIEQQRGDVAVALGAGRLLEQQRGSTLIRLGSLGVAPRLVQRNAKVVPRVGRGAVLAGGQEY